MTRCLTCHALIPRGPRCRACDHAYRGTQNQRMAFRLAVLLRDGYRCVQCGHGDPSGRTLEADHIVPLSRGGEPFNRANGRCLCKRCHATVTSAAARSR